MSEVLHNKSNQQASAALARLDKRKAPTLIYISKRGNVMLADTHDEPEGATIVGVYKPGVPAHWLYEDFLHAHQARDAA